MNKYKVWVSNSSNFIVKAKSARNARLQVWESIKSGFTYGWERADFLENASTEKLS